MFSFKEVSEELTTFIFIFFKDLVKYSTASRLSPSTSTIVIGCSSDKSCHFLFKLLGFCLLETY